MSVPVRVMACLTPGRWRVLIGPGVPALDGGVAQDWPEHWLPADKRLPNHEFWVEGFEDGRPRIAEPPAIVTAAFTSGCEATPA